MNTRSEALRRLEEALSLFQASAYTLRHRTQQLKSTLHEQSSEGEVQDAPSPASLQLYVDPNGHIVEK